MRTAVDMVPSGWGHIPISVTRPAAEEWMGTDTKPSASPTGSPRSTWSPTCTQTVAGFPACWRSGSTISSGKGIRRIGS